MPCGIASAGGKGPAVCRLSFPGPGYMQYEGVCSRTEIYFTEG